MHTRKRSFLHLDEFNSIILQKKQFLAFVFDLFTGTYLKLMDPKLFENLVSHL